MNKKNNTSKNKSKENAVISQDVIYDNWDYDGFAKTKAVRILKNLPQKKHIKFLDVASGYGQFFRFLKNIDCEYYGIDISKKQVQKGVKSGLNISCHDLTKKWPYKNGTFDVVLAAEIVEHVFDTDFLLQECYRVLKKNGVLILTTPNICYLGARIRCLFGRRPPSIEFRTGGNNSGHIRAFSYYDLKELFSDNGFKIEYFRGYDFYLPFMSSETKYFGKICDCLSFCFPKFASGFLIKATKI